MTRPAASTAASAGVVRARAMWRIIVTSRHAGTTMTDPASSPTSFAPVDRSRRDFVALSVATGLGAAGAPALAALAVSERDVEIRTADGICDAAFFHPATGSHPGVLV